MTAQSKKTEQKRLDCCVLGQPKWTKIHETLKKCAGETLKTAPRVAGPTVSFENGRKIHQHPSEMMSLGKYQF